MPPFKGTEVFFSDTTATVVVKEGEGSVAVKGGWVVVEVDSETTQYPARVIRKVTTR